MKNRLIKNKQGFTLIEAVMAMSLVVIAASMSVGVFTGYSKVSDKQYSINQGQSTALSKAQSDLSVEGGGTGTSFVMEPVGSDGFGTLEDNGKVSANYVVASDMNGDVNYKYFKYDNPDLSVTVSEDSDDTSETTTSATES